MGSNTGDPFGHPWSGAVGNGVLRWRGEKGEGAEERRRSKWITEAAHAASDGGVTFRY